MLILPNEVLATQPCPAWRDSFAQQQIEALKQKIAQHDAAYFEYHQPLLSDHAYDALVQQYQFWQQCFTKASSAIPKPVNQTKKLGTLYKSNGDHDIERFWQTHQDQQLILQPKIDGIAIALTYQYGHLTHAVTRKGTNILDHIMAAPNIPKHLNIDKTVTLHGELFINLQTISNMQLNQYVSARHLIAGLMQQQEPDQAMLNSVIFFPWRWVNSPYDTEPQQLTPCMILVLHYRYNTATRYQR